MQLPEFKNQSLRDLAFTHRSYLNENREAKQSNERLEFLGDSILSFVVSSAIYEQYPDLPEGELTSMRSVLTNTQTFYLLAQRLNLGEQLIMSKGEEESGGRESKSILANTYEAFVGALYLDQGIEAVRAFVKETILDSTDEFIGQQGLKDPKSRLQEYMQEKYKVSPEYRILDEIGPDHDKTYTAGVFLDDKLVAKGTGHSKQEAEKDAAQKSLEAFSAPQE